MRAPAALLAAYDRRTGKVCVRLELYEGRRTWRTWTTFRGQTRYYECTVLEPDGQASARGASRAAMIVVTLLRLDWPELSRAAVWSPRNDLPVISAGLVRSTGRVRAARELCVA